MRIIMPAYRQALVKERTILISKGGGTGKKLKKSLSPQKSEKKFLVEIDEKLC